MDADEPKTDLKSGDDKSALLSRVHLAVFAIAQKMEQDYRQFQGADVMTADRLDRLATRIAQRAAAGKPVWHELIDPTVDPASVPYLQKYVYKSLRFARIDALRRKAAARRSDDQAAQVERLRGGETQEPATGLIAEELRRAVDIAIERLSERERDFVRVYLELETPRVSKAARKAGIPYSSAERILWEFRQTILQECKDSEPALAHLKARGKRLN